MIEVLIDHSYQDDYLMISRISVNVKDSLEKERIERILDNYKLEGTLIGPGDNLRESISKLLKVDIKNICLDTHEIDLY